MIRDKAQLISAALGMAVAMDPTGRALNVLSDLTPRAPEPRVLTDEDKMRMEAAEAKRARKAAKLRPPAIMLNAEESRRFEAIMTDPPAPNENLMRAMANYQKIRNETNS